MTRYLSLPTTVAAVRAALDDDSMTLSHLMEFDCAITVHPDGTITDSNEYAPSLCDDELDSPRWELMDGYTGQYGYAGPIMHNSEYIGGRMAGDILDTPGTYVAVVSDYSPDELTPDDIPEDFPVRPVDTGSHCFTCGLSWDDSIVTEYTPAPSARCPFEEFHPDEDNAEGWAVARLITDGEAPVLAHETERYNA